MPPPPPRKVYWNNRQPHWTKEHVLKAFLLWRHEYGDFPTNSQWKSPFLDRTRYPNPNTVRRAFGSWAAAVEAARKARPARPRWSQEEIIEAMQAWAEKYGAPPGVEDWRKNPDFPTYSRVRDLFGGWTQALQAAGFQPRTAGVTKQSIQKYLPLPRRR